MILPFAVRLVCGMSGVWCVMSRQHVTSGFFRIQMLVTLGLSVLVALMASSATDQPGVIATGWLQTGGWVLAGLSFVGSVLWTLERRRAGAACGGLILAVSLAVLGGLVIPAEHWGTTSVVVPIVSELSAVLLLGTATVGMLLGHWYLTATGMRLEPLEQLARMFLGAGVARLVVAAVALALGWSAVDGLTQVIWLVLRWTAGIAGPLVMAVMILRILKFRNTQSATGVFFAGVILVFLGEMTAGLLFQELRIVF